MKAVRLMAGVVALVAFAASAVPASALTRWADPTFGKATLDAGGGGVAVPIVAGGPIDAAGQGGLPDGCAGFMNLSPDFRFEFLGGTDVLVVTATAAVGTTIVVDTPGEAGGWLCSAAGEEPARVTIPLPTEGVYNVWVGTVADAGRHSALLEVRVGAPAAAAAVAGAALTPDAAPLFGAAAVAFPLTRIDAAIAAGGTIDAARSVGAGCAGFITAAPTYRLTVAPTETARLVIRVRQTRVDTTLVIRQPDGTWLCADDDADTLDATVMYRTPVPGTYDVWVGTYAPTAPVSAVLRIAEPNPGEPVAN